MNISTAASTALSVLAALPQLIAGVERLLPHATGATKSQTVKSYIGFGAQVAGAFLTPEQAVLAGLSEDAVDKVIDATVGIYNATGFFKKGNQKTPTTPTPDAVMNAGAEALGITDAPKTAVDHAPVDLGTTKANGTS